MPNNIRVVLSFDHPMFREGVIKTFAAEPDFEIIGEGVNADNAVRLARELLPDIILLDLSMPGGGIEAARRIAAAYPVVKIVVLTASELNDDLAAALKAGVRGYIPKRIGGSDLINIVRRIHRGELYVSPDLAARLLVEMQTDRVNGPKRDPVSKLTAREEQILELVARALSNKEIGRELRIQEKTVKHYMTNILQKLHVRNRVEAALVAHHRLSS